MSFRILGLDPAPFLPLYGLDDAALQARGARRVRVGPDGGVPDRVELRDLADGETALLLNFVHQPADTPFRASHAIYVREGATAARSVDGRVPAVMARRLLSLRAFDAGGMMVDADVVEGTAAAGRIVAMLDAPAVDYLHAHYARPGCFAARVERLAR
ncbi:DUF1203 domain-containing protein [Cognatilysobacter segetis]|uniref:DUF1203 domain-containing protein n=1 Tax=Cognatilysobacter segetis TaxID=2492394 RepID=UPI00105F07BD|nr:DUF1203 domain-containing protein [Lysobacter segetis]